MKGVHGHGRPEGVGCADAPTLRGANGESGQGLNQVEALHSPEPHADGITSPSGEVIGQAEVSDAGHLSRDVTANIPTQFAPTNWQARLAAAVELTFREKASRRSERQLFARAREYGLTRRHAAKLARITVDNVSTLNRGDKPTVDPTVAQRATVEAEEQASDARSTAMDVERADGTVGAAPIPPQSRSTRRPTTHVPQRRNGDRQ